MTEMSESCPACFTTVKGQQQELAQVRVKAKQYAVENEKMVAIYREGYEFRFMVAEKAIETGLHIIEYVSCG